MGTAFSFFQLRIIGLSFGNLLLDWISMILEECVIRLVDYLISYEWYWGIRIEETDFFSHAIYMTLFNLWLMGLRYPNAIFITPLILRLVGFRYSEENCQEQWYYPVLKRYEKKEKRPKEMRKSRKRSKKMRKSKTSLKVDFAKISLGGTSPAVDEDDEEEKG